MTLSQFVEHVVLRLSYISSKAFVSVLYATIMKDPAHALVISAIFTSSSFWSWIAQSEALSCPLSELVVEKSKTLVAHYQSLI